MSKRAEQNRISSTSNGVALEHNTVYDDNLLPAADELAKLNAIDLTGLVSVISKFQMRKDK